MKYVDPLQFTIAALNPEENVGAFWNVDAVKMEEGILTFILAGKAKFTLRSKQTGKHFTYMMIKSKDGQRFYVKVLTGPDNTSDYSFLGTIFDASGDYVTGKKSRIASGAPSSKAFKYFWKHVTEGPLPEQLEFWHEGKCGKCGRTLTVPESIAVGIGPICRGDK